MWHYVPYIRIRIRIIMMVACESLCFFSVTDFINKHLKFKLKLKIKKKQRNEKKEILN